MSKSKDVDVQVDVVQQHGSWKAEPARDPIVVNGQGVNIRFTLATPGWEFHAHNPITVSNGGSQFPDPAQRVSPTTATLFDANNERGKHDFHYCIRVRRTSDGHEAVTDPTIRNELD